MSLSIGMTTLQLGRRGGGHGGHGTTPTQTAPVPKRRDGIGDGLAYGAMAGVGLAIAASFHDTSVLGTLVGSIAAGGAIDYILKDDAPNKGGLFGLDHRLHLDRTVHIPWMYDSSQ